MPTAGSGERFAIERIPENLFRAPLDYLASDHVRMTRICGTLEHLIEAASGGMGEDDLADLLAFLEGDFLAHMADEIEVLFPRLLKRCPPEDAAGPVLGSVTRSHENDRLLVSELTKALRILFDPDQQDQATASRLVRISVALIESLRRHLPLEDDKLLPLARRRLTEADLEELGRSMAARRGVVYPE